MPRDFAYIRIQVRENKTDIEVTPGDANDRKKE